MSGSPLIITLDEECSICIEKLLDATNNPIAKVIPCNHHYHDMCIKSWSLQANSCPTCRAQFNKVEVVDKFGNIILDYKVEDKEFPMDPNYLAPSAHDEYNIEEQEQQLITEQIQQLENYSVPFGVRCALCSVTANGGLSICNNCSSSFHNHCLDTAGIHSGYWQCPLCENVQESISFTPSTTRRTRRRAIATAANSSSATAPATTRTRRNQYTQRTDNTYLRLSRHFRNNNDEHISTMLTQSNNGSREDNMFERVEEENAWSEFENLRKHDGTLTSSSKQRMVLSPAVTTVAEHAPVGKLKRPSRRGKFPNRDRDAGQRSSTTASGSSLASTSNISKKIVIPKNTYKSTVMSLISEMHSNNSKSEEPSKVASSSFQSGSCYSGSDASSSKDLESTFSQFTPPISPSSSSSSPGGYLSPTSSRNSNFSSSKGKEKL